MEYTILGVCVLMILLVSVFTEARIIRKDKKIAQLTEHINDLEQTEEMVVDKFNNYVALIAEIQKKYLELSRYSETLLEVLNKEVGEEKAESLILDALVVEHATDINQLFKDLVEDFSNDEESDYTDEESEEDRDVR